MSNDTRVAVGDAAAPTDNSHMAQDSSKPRQANDQHEPLSEGSVSVPESTPPISDTVPDEKEFGGQAGPDPTRYGDWEKKGRVTDF